MNAVAADLLENAVVDVTTLAATCRALARDPAPGDPIERRKLRARLREDLGLGTRAYLDALARSRQGVFDGRALSSCRLAAEREMKRAIRHQDELRRLMATEPGALEGFAAARQDLWRLAHITMHLRQGRARLRAAGVRLDPDAQGRNGGSLQRRLRRAAIAYARVLLRGREEPGRLLGAVRGAALAEIGEQGFDQAERLGRLEDGSGDTQALIRAGVLKPLRDLVLDWRPAK